MSAADSLMADASTSAVKAESGADAAVKAEGAAGPASSADAKPAGDASSADDARAANRTLYLTNLNQKVKLDVLKQSLLGLFGTYGEVLSVTAHRNVRMRGQAFVAFKEQDAATKAKAEVAGFPLYGKPMQLDYARSRSDAVVADEAGGVDTPQVAAHKAARLEQKRKTRRNNPLRRKMFAKVLAAKAAAKAAAEGGEEGAEAAAAVPVPAASKRQEPQMPDEYLPPNPILFLQNVPGNVGREDLEKLFQGYAGFTDVRLIPGRPVAFAEFADSASSAVAKDALNGHEFGAGERLKVTFAR